MPLALLPDQPALDTYGAPKRDFGESIDPASEASAAEYNGMAATLTALAFAGPRLWVQVSSTGTLLSWGSVWGNTSAPPTTARNSTGNYSVTAPSSVPDTLDGTARAFAPRTSIPGANTDQRGASATLSGQVFTVKTYNLSGGALADSAFTLLIF